jgi:hypothetical protein
VETLDFCKEHRACRGGSAWALSVSDDMADVWDALIDQHKYEWLLWVAERVLDDRTLRLLACRFVRETPLADGRKVWDLLTDERSRKAVEVAERHADGLATYDELAAVWAAAWAAAWDASGAAARAAARDAAWAAAGAAAAAGDAAWDASGAAVWAASGAAVWAAAGDAAWDASGAAVWAAARDAAWDASGAAAWAAAWAAARAAARDAAWAAQCDMFRDIPNPFRGEK